MFEFFVAKSYLIPKKRNLSVSIIASLSVLVISVVIWLVLLFLSVTSGIEKNWLTKLTAINGPVQIIPTKKYYRSYYYQIDRYSYLSGYHTKTLKEKFLSEKPDPYDPNFDEQLPSYFPQNSHVDYVKKVHEIANGLKKTYPSLGLQDYEIGGGLLKLHMTRPDPFGLHSENRLTQAVYLSSICSNNPQMASLLMLPCAADVSQLIFQAQQGGEAMHLLPFIEIYKADLHPFKELPSALLPDNCKLHAIEKAPGIYEITSYEGPCYLEKKSNQWQFFDGKKTLEITKPLKLISQNTLPLKDIRIEKEKVIASLNVQGYDLRGAIPIESLLLQDVKVVHQFDEKPKQTPPWVYSVKGKVYLPEGSLHPIVLPKNYRSSGVCIGDKGYFSFASMSSAKAKEQKLPFYVCGFYDPGIMPIGAKFAFSSDEIVRLLNAQSETVAIDPMLSNGFQMWFSDLSKTNAIVSELEDLFEKQGILEYFQIIPYSQFDFAKDLFQQFQSDKNLFLLIGVIILVVACTNVLTLLLLLVNDKKKEIGILRAMGASKKSTLSIFAACGFILGSISACIGILATLMTLRHLDALVAFLSFIQGHDAFNAAFYGSSLPSELNPYFIIVIAIATPIFSTLAAIIGAYKALKNSPAQTLRGI